MKTITSVFLASLAAQAAFGQEGQPERTVVETVGVGSMVAYQTALARADVAVAKSLLNERVLKGEVGEAIRDQTVGRYLHRSGQWLNVSPRLGPQGLDHVSVQLNESDRPHRLMVDETKFGSSKLLTTTSGDIQMGDKYISQRLSGLAKRFDTIRAQADMPSARAPSRLPSNRVVRVPLSDSESVLFWRPAEGAGSWRYDGPPESLPKALSQLKSLSTLFQAAAEGRIDFPKRIFQVKIDGDHLKVKILDARAVDASGGNLSKLPVKANIELPLERALGRAVWASDAIEANLVNELRRQMPYLDSAEARRLAQGIQTTARTPEDALVRSSLKRFAIVQTAKTGAAGVLIVLPIELAMQLFDNEPEDWSRVAGVAGLAGGSAAVGNLAGSTTTYVLVRTKLGYSASVEAAEILGLRSAGRFANVAGGAVGGSTIAVLFAYGGYWLGYYDIQTANRSAVAGLAGVGAGTAASALTLGLISTHATAGTGVAISSLSGAAAKSASLAWLGGGSVASGGLGVAGGSAALTAGVALVAVGVTSAVFYGFHVYDEAQDNIRLSRTIDYLSEKQTFFIQNTETSFSR
jgi:hypothetical protein